MEELISRKYIRERVEEYRKSKEYSEADEMRNIIVNCILDDIDNAPTVEHSLPEPYEQEEQS